MEITESKYVLNRGNGHIYYGCILVTLLYSLILYRTTNAAVIFLPLAMIFLSSMVWSFCLFLEECKHVALISSGNYLDIFWRTFSMNTCSSIFRNLSFLVVIVLLSTQNFEEFQDIDSFSLMLSFCTAFILSRILHIEMCPTWKSHTMGLLNGLDYGSGMAHSFVHGYLKLVLPAKGDNNLSILDRIKAFLEAQELEEHHFPVMKLITLVPRSGHSFPLLQDEPSQAVADPDIEPATHLQDHMRNRAGTKGRVYRGGAYKLRVREGNKVSFLYTIAEGATPLLTFREAYSSPGGERLREHKADVVSNFYKTVKHMIQNDKEIRDLADLIYYDDEGMNRQDVVALLRNHLLKARDKMLGQ